MNFLKTVSDSPLYDADVGSPILYAKSGTRFCTYYNCIFVCLLIFYHLICLWWTLPASLSVWFLSVFCCSDTNWWYQYYPIQPYAPENSYTYPAQENFVNKSVPGRGKGNSNRRWCCTEVDYCWDVNFCRELVFMNSTWLWNIAGTQKVLAALLGEDGDVKGGGYHEVFAFFVSTSILLVIVMS